MTNVNYASVVPQTFEERVAMYMKCKKEDLARMLAERDKYTSPDACAEIKNDDNNDASVTWVSTTTF